MLPMPALNLMQAWKAIITMMSDHFSGAPLWIPGRKNNWSFFISEDKWVTLISCSMGTAYKTTSNQTEKT